jgi:hypothetical protein
MSSNPFYKQLCKVPLHAGQLNPSSLQRHVELTDLAKTQSILGDLLKTPLTTFASAAIGTKTVLSSGQLAKI